MSAENRNFRGAAAFVEFGLREQELGRRESASGPGSARAAAAPCLDLLDAVVGQYGIRSILDLGCGDWNWMRHAAWRSDPAVRYEGWEAHQGLVERLSAEFGDQRTVFRMADITAMPLPRADLVVCRDVLFHLPLAQAEQVVRGLRANGALLVATCFLDVASNTDIRPSLRVEDWGFYHINLDIAPFDLRPFRLRAIPEPVCSENGDVRSVCLYDLGSDLAGQRGTAPAMNE